MHPHERNLENKITKPKSFLSNNIIKTFLDFENNKYNKLIVKIKTKNIKKIQQVNKQKHKINKTKFNNTQNIF